jgi:hypothetical protein
MRCIFIRQLALFLGFILFLAIGRESEAICIRITDPKDLQTVSGFVNIQAVLAVNTCDKNLSYPELNAVFDKYGTQYSSDLLKALAWHESGWTQFTPEGDPYRSPNPNSIDWGIMQINDKTNALNLSKEQIEKVKSDLEYCIQMGIITLDQKTKDIARLKKRKDWQIKQQNYALADHSDQDILIKAYNGFRKSWDYADAIKKHLKNRPWESQAQVTLLINGKLENTCSIRLIDTFTHPWDTTKLDDGWQAIQAQTGKGKNQASHNIKVNTRNEKPKIIGTISGVVQNEELSTRFKIEFSTLELKPAPTPSPELLQKQKESSEALKKAKIPGVDIDALIKASQAYENQPQNKAENNPAKYSGWTIEGKALVSLDIQQRQILTGEMKFSNPYYLQCTVAGSLFDRQSYIAGSKARGNIPVIGIASYPVQSSETFNGDGDLIFVLGFTCGGGKDIKYIVKPLIKGPVYIFSKDGTRKVEGTPVISGEGHDSYFNLEHIFQAANFEGKINDKQHKIIISTDSVHIMNLTMNNQGKIEYVTI